MLPTLFVPHGAPTFVLHPDAAGAALVAIARRLPRPRAILAVSAHWTTESPMVGSDPEPETLHDFHGFPPALYDLNYPAPGDPDLARQISERLGEAGCRVQAGRGLDHGVWIPLSLMYPRADIPVVPFSVQPGLGPEHHWRLGRTLAPLREEGVMVLGSGNLTHNLRDWHTARGTPDYVPRFADWIWHHLAAGEREALLDYRQRAPDAIRAHPSDEHLLPLFVALGAAGADFRAERLYQGVSERILAMDSVALWPSQP